MGRVVEEHVQILVRYFWRDTEGLIDDDTVFWLCADKEQYVLRILMSDAYDWVPRYGWDLKLAVDMANKLAQIIRVGRVLIKQGYEFELVMVRDVTKRTITPLDKDNAMIVLALATL